MKLRDRLYPMVRRGHLAALIMLMALAACADQPVGPDKARTTADADDSTDSAKTGRVRAPHSLIHERAWIIDTGRTPLVSSATELADGLYRLRDQDGSASSIRRDDVILAAVTA